MESSGEAMGREEPPSKKRVALRQIRKDDVSDSDDEDGGSGAMEGTFRRASDQVLAERRIVKVRRGPLASSGSNPGPSPFAGIRLVPPSIPVPVNNVVPPLPNPSNSNSTESKVVVEEVLPKSDIEPEASAVKPSVEVLLSKEVAGNTTIATGVLLEVEKNSVSLGPDGEVAEGNSAQISADVIEYGKQPASVVTDLVDAVVNGDESEKVRGAELVGSSGTSSETFEQLSSAKNAFAGSFGTGFSSSASILNSSSTTSSQTSSGFAFGQSFTFGSSASFGTGQSPAPFGSKSAFQGTFPSVSSIFGKSNGSGASPLFGSLTPAVPNPLSGPMKSSVVSLQEVPVETGEEKEKAIFTADAALFEFLDGGWKERGKGELKLNVSEEKDKKPRLVMRSKGNYRLLLNANLFPDMKLSKMDNRGISFVCVNSAAQGRTGLSTYAVKLRDPFAESEFTTTVQAHKGSPNSEPRTPESSPKATERPSKAVETSEIEA